MTLRVLPPPGREAERRYVAELVFREWLGLDVELAEGAVGATELTDGERSLRLPDVLFATDDWLGPRSLPDVEVRDGVPLLYGDDLLGAIFFCLTRYEELVVRDRDEHDRFDAASSVATREGFLGRPVVQEWVDLLWAQLAATWPRLERRRREPRVLPSCDVDQLTTTGVGLRGRIRSAGGDVLTRRNPLLAARRLAGHDPARSLDWLMDRSEEHGLRTAFYFLARQGGKDADYALDEPTVRAQLRRIHERGHEIGLHASFETYRDPARLRDEADTLRRVLDEEGIDRLELGGRQHWLRWEAPTTWRAWADAGLAYDSSLAYDDHTGFRASCCWEYPVFDLEERRVLPLRERPLVAMDVQLIEVVRRPEDEARAELARLRDTCRAHGGDFTLLWHNTWVAVPAHRRLYTGALADS